MNTFLKITGLLFTLMYSPVASALNVEKEAENVIQAYEVKMWRTAIGVVLELEEEVLEEEIKFRNDIGRFLKNFDCPETNCDNQKLLEAFQSAEKINVFSQVKGSPIDDEHTLDGLKIYLGKQLPEAGQFVNLIYLEASRDKWLTFLLGQDQDQKEQILKKILKEGKPYALLKQINEATNEGRSLNCNRDPFNCSLCCYLIKKVLPPKIALIKFNTPNEWYALQEALEEVTSDAENGLNEREIQAINGPFPVDSKECIDQYEKLIKQKQEIVPEEEECAKHLSAKDKQLLVWAQRDYKNYNNAPKENKNDWNTFHKRLVQLSFYDELDLDQFRRENSNGNVTILTIGLYLLLVLGIIGIIVLSRWLIKKLARRGSGIERESEPVYVEPPQQPEKKAWFWRLFPGSKKQPPVQEKDPENQPEQNIEETHNTYDDKNTTQSNTTDMNYSQSGKDSTFNHPTKDDGLSGSGSSQDASPYYENRQESNQKQRWQDTDKDAFVPPTPSHDRNSLKTLYAARPDGPKGFLLENLTDRKEYRLPYQIEILDNTTAKYRISTDREIQKQAANNAYYVLQDACDYSGTLPEQMKNRIETLSAGILLFNGKDEWEIKKKLKIRFV